MSECIQYVNETVQYNNKTYYVQIPLYPKGHSYEKKEFGYGSDVCYSYYVEHMNRHILRGLPSKSNLYNTILEIAKSRHR